MTMTAIAVTPQTFSTITQQLPATSLSDLRKTYENALDNNETVYVVRTDDPSGDAMHATVGIAVDDYMRRYCAYDTDLINRQFTEIAILF